GSDVNVAIAETTAYGMAGRLDAAE
ncbi:MAG: hypothetical protein ACI8WY_002809, partial [Planctomycetota bacterium]